MDHFDAALTQAEQQKAAADPVRRAKEELAPVRAWAVQAKQQFAQGKGKLQPRREKALSDLNRVSHVLGAPPSQLVMLWQQLEAVWNGTEGSYEQSIQAIDHLTPYLAGQPIYLAQLRNKPNCPPGSIGHVLEALARVESSLREYIAALPSAQPATVMGVVKPERGPAELPVEVDFTPQMPRLGPPSLY